VVDAGSNKPPRDADYRHNTLRPNKPEDERNTPLVVIALPRRFSRGPNNRSHTPPTLCNDPAPKNGLGKYDDSPIRWA